MTPSTGCRRQRRQTPAALSLAAAATLAASPVASALGLSIGTLTPGSGSGAAGTTVVATLPSGTWSDSSLIAAGWNGSIALSLFHYQSSWVQTAGATRSLGTTTSGNFVANAEGSYVVTVTSYAAPALAYSIRGVSTGTGTATLGAGTTTSAIAGGVTITWGPQSTAYAAGMAYTIAVGNLPPTALVLNNATHGSITPTTGTTSPAPVFTNQTATPAEGSGADPTQTVGLATIFLTAALLQGHGDYVITPSATITSDSAAWAQTYTAQVSYTIAALP